MKVKEVGATPRRLAKAMTDAQKTSWNDTGVVYHSERRDLRFTDDHARKARYGPRQGERLPRNSREYFISYTGRKERLHGHTRKMEFSGQTRREVSQVRISVTSKGARLSYAGARKLNLRGRGQRVRPNEEFRRFTRDDEQVLIKAKDSSLEKELNNDNIRGEVSFK